MESPNVIPVRAGQQDLHLDQCALLARQAGAGNLATLRYSCLLLRSRRRPARSAPTSKTRRGSVRTTARGCEKLVSPSAARTSGGPGLHPTAGACAVGARKFLVAYNIYFDSADVSLVRALAKELRASAGGLKGVKAMGVLAHGRAQL